MTDIQSDTSDPNIVYVRKTAIEEFNASEKTIPTLNSYPHALNTVDPEEDKAGGAAEKAAGFRHSCFLGMVVSIPRQSR